MDGEIITTGEQMKAQEHYDTLLQVSLAYPALEPQLKPIADFLSNLAWKGSH